MNPISENIFVAIDTIIAKRLESLRFDKTEICTVIQVKDNNEYVVSNGSAKYNIKSIGTYREKDQVYVTIPNGDYTKEKIIVGKYVSSDDKTFQVVRPFDKFVDLEIYNEIKLADLKIIANGEKKEVTQENIITGDKELAGYTRMGIKANFQTLLPQNTTTGKYGLSIQFKVDEKEGEAVYHSYEFTFADMIGNPYYFTNGSEQEAVFYIEDLKKLDGTPVKLNEMRICLTQDGNFSTLNGKVEDYYNGKEPLENIILKNLEISFGYSVDDPQFKDGTGAYIYTLSPLSYGPGNQEEKQIGLNWLYNNKIDRESDLNIKWYEFRLGEPAADEYSGLYWKKLENEERTLTFVPDGNINENKIKAVVIFEGKSYTSNEIVFMNEQDMGGTLQTAKLTALTINTEDKSNGNYFLYNTAHGLTDNSLSQQDRQLSLSFDISKITGTAGSSTNLDGVDWVEYIIPAKNTMIKMPNDNINNRIKFEYNGQWKSTHGSIVKEESSLPTKYFIYIPKSGFEEVTSDYFNFGEEQTITDGVWVWIKNTENNYELTKRVNVIDEVMYLKRVTRTGNNKTETYIEVSRNDLPEVPTYYSEGQDTYRIKIERNGETNWRPQITYRIASTYYTAYTNNTIRAIAKYLDNEFTAALDMLFGVCGTSGLEYTFIMDVVEDRKKYLNVSKENDSVQLQLYLTDKDGNDITDQILNTPQNNRTIEWYISYCTGSQNITYKIENTDKTFFVLTNSIDCQTISAEPEKITLKLAENNIIVPIISAKTTWGGYNIEAKYALPIVTMTGLSEVNDTHIYSNFSPLIKYDTSGIPYDYNKAKLFLYQQFFKDGTEHWNTVHSDSMTPVVSDIIQPKKVYINDSNIAYIQCEIIQQGSNKSLIWRQAFIISQDIYPSGILNDWDGKLTINEQGEKQYIASPKIVAGKKNSSNNSFTGVVLGDWESENEVFGTGIYGFDSGVMRYSLNEDGSVEFKHKNGGTIIMDDDKFILQSGNYKNGKGTYIDLDNGEMELNGYITWGGNNSKYGATQLNGGKIYSPIIIGQEFRSSNLYLIAGNDEPDASEKLKFDCSKDGIHFFDYDYYDGTENNRTLKEVFGIHYYHYDDPQVGSIDYTYLTGAGQVVVESYMDVYGLDIWGAPNESNYISITGTELLWYDDTIQKEVLQLLTIPDKWNTPRGLYIYELPVTITDTLKVNKITDLEGNPIGGTAVFV